MTATKAGAEPRRRHPSPVRKDLLRAAAREVILEVGVAGATVREIAAAAGVSVGTLTYHYSSVEEILDDVLRHESMQFIESIEARVKAETSPLRQIRLMTEPFIGDDPELVAYWVLWMAYLTRAAHQPALREYTALRFRGWEQQMREIVTAGCASGDFHVNDETAAVRAIIALVDGLSLQHIFFRPDAVTTADRRRMRTAINAVLGIS